MNPMSKLLLLAATAPFAFAGCTTTNPKAAFDQLGDTVASRTGQRVQWLAGDSEIENVRRMVESALQTNFTAHSASAIALLNNRALQAQFEELGISQADLAKASRLRNPTFTGFARFPTSGAGAANIEG